MAILCYTTTIAAAKSVGDIQARLARARAQAVLCEYDAGGQPSALSFRIMTAHGLVTFRMPARIEGVLKRLERDPSVPRKLRTREQAARVAWRICLAWVEAQLAICEAGAAELAEVFLAYAQTAPDGRTLYESIAAGGFKALAGPGG